MFRSVPLHCIHLYDLSVYIICIYIYIYNMINMCTYAYDMSYVEFYIISRFWTFPANPQGTPEQQTADEHLPLPAAALLGCQRLGPRHLWRLEAAEGFGGRGALPEALSGVEHTAKI